MALYRAYWRSVLTSGLGWRADGVEQYLSSLTSPLVLHERPGCWIVGRFLTDDEWRALSPERRRDLTAELTYAIDPEESVYKYRLPFDEQEIARMLGRVRTVFAAFGLRGDPGR
jgi:hypothetical protein